MGIPVCKMPLVQGALIQWEIAFHENPYGNQFGLKRLWQSDATQNGIKIVNEKWMKAIDEFFLLDSTWMKYF